MRRPDCTSRHLTARRAASTTTLALSGLVSLFLCVAGNTAQAVVEASDKPLQISIAAGSLADSLDKLGEQARVQIMYEPSLAEGIRVTAVNGTLTVHDALAQLLAQTGLKADRVNDRTVVLRRTDATKEMTIVPADNTKPATGAGAGEPEVPTVPEITVTARKRQERLQDVPASIAAASDETIAQLNIVGVTEMDAIAPGLTFVTNPSRFGSGPSIALRGISTQTQSSGVQDSVGIVIDGVPVSRAKAGSFPDLSDTARMEVLRGPQGTLFGKNASAGVISVTTKDPTTVFESEVSLAYSTHDTRTLRASASGPIAGDALLGRISGYSSRRDEGYVTNIFDDTDWEKDDQKGFRGKLLFTPTAADTFKLSADYVEQKNDAGTNIIRGFTPVTPQYVIDALQSIAGPDNDRINTHSLGNNRHESAGAALQWDRSLGRYTLTALGAHRTFTQDFHQGTYAWLTPLNDGDITGFTDLDQSSAEVRIASPIDGRVNYVAGLFLLADTVDVGIMDPAPGLLVVGTTNRTARNYASTVDTVNYAAFAEANVNVTDHFTLTGGLRWTHENVDVDITGNPIPADAIRRGHPLGITSDSATAEKLSWRAGGQWRVDADRMFYVSVATGFKGPGFNVNSNVLGDAQPVAPEISTSYEIGMKSQYLDRRLTLNLNVFRSVFEDFQAQGGLVPPGNTAATIVLLNAEELRTQGFEAEMAASLGESFEIGANASYIDAQYERFTNAPCYAGQNLTAPGTCVGNVQDLSGKRLANTPEWSFNLFARRDFAIPKLDWRGFATLDYSWRDDVQWDALGSPNGIEDAYGLLGASLGLRSGDGRASVKVYGKNLADQFHTSGIVVGGQITHFLPPTYRRIVGVNVSFAF